MGLSLRGFLVAGIISMGGAAYAADAKPTAFPPCTTTATDADRKAAQGAFAAGQASFNEADYPTAIVYWRDAYRRDCSAHALLLNLARAYELKGDRGEAVNALETYLQRKPDASDAEQIRRRIENLKTQIAAAEKSAAPAPLPSPASSVAAPPPAAQPTPMQSSAPPSAQPAADSAESKGSRSPVPLFVAAGGGVLAIAGAVVLAGGISKVNEAADACPDRKNCQDTNVVDQGNAGRTQQVVGGIVLGAGGVAVAGGLLWYFLSSPSGDSAPRTALGRARAVPAFAPGYAGISLGTTF
ncbi:MAG: tetratricopeptide repeat protein [Polyangiaceae bacterium]